MPRYYPVFLDVMGRRCAVFGGNHEGERKVRFLLGCGAHVTLFSLDADTTGGLKSLADAGDIEWTARGYSRGDLEGVWIAIVADTSSAAVNEQVSVEARERNVALNVMDVTPLCTFIAPAIIQRKDTTVAVSTAGTSPALARRLREELTEDPKWTRWADAGPVLAEARMVMRKRGVVVCPETWQELMTPDWLELAERDASAARDELVAGLSARHCVGCADAGRCRKHG